MKKQIAFFGLMMLLSYGALICNTNEKYKSNLTETEQSIYKDCIENFTAKNLTSITDEQIKILMKRQQKLKREIEYSNGIIKSGWFAVLPHLPIWLIPLIPSIKEANPAVPDLPIWATPLISIKEANAVGFLFSLSIILPSLFYIGSNISSASKNKEIWKKELDLIGEILDQNTARNNIQIELPANTPDHIG